MNAISSAYALPNIDAPTVIHSDAQNEHYIAVLESLERAANTTPEEKALAELLTVLISNYEEQHFQLRRSTPAEAITTLMEANDLSAKDVVDVFGSESIATGVLSGSRELTADQIRKLSQKFNVSPDLFF